MRTRKLPPRNPDTGTVVIDDQWHQIIATYAAQSDTLNIFVDPSVGDTSGDFLIDEVAVFDRVLSGAELDQLIASGPQSF